MEKWKKTWENERTCIAIFYVQNLRMAAECAAFSRKEKKAMIAFLDSKSTKTQRGRSKLAARRQK
jgi:hypothetical protein